MTVSEVDLLDTPDLIAAGAARLERRSRRFRRQRLVQPGRGDPASVRQPRTGSQPAGDAGNRGSPWRTVRPASPQLGREERRRPPSRRGDAAWVDPRHPGRGGSARVRGGGGAPGGGGLRRDAGPSRASLEPAREAGRRRTGTARSRRGTSARTCCRWGSAGIPGSACRALGENRSASTSRPGAGCR